MVDLFLHLIVLVMLLLPSLLLGRSRLYASAYPHWLTGARHHRTTPCDLGCRSRRRYQHRVGSSRSVKQAAERIRYDSQLEVARQLGVDSDPLPFNESQRSACGKHYDDIPVGQVEPDGHEILWRESGGSQEMKLTGSYASLRPLYQRRSSELSFIDFKKMLAADYRRLMVQNHLHKCTKSCFKGSLKRKKTGCRRGF